MYKLLKMISKPVIVFLPRKRTLQKNYYKIVNRKNSDKCLTSKKKLSNLVPSDFEFPEETKIYLSENLNSHYRNLAFHCRRMKRERVISKFKFQNEAFHVTI